MPYYEVTCRKCEHEYEVASTMSEKEKKVKAAKCPQCKSKAKDEGVPKTLNYAFAQPEGTGRYIHSQLGHDFRLKTKLPKIREEREAAEAFSHMGADPYGSLVEQDFALGEGIHDPETRPGLS